MKVSSSGRKQAATIGGATAALSGNALMVFKDIPHFPFFTTVRGLVVGLPIAFTIGLFYKMTRRSEPDPEA